MSKEQTWKNDQLEIFGQIMTTVTRSINFWIFGHSLWCRNYTCDDRMNSMPKQAAEKPHQRHISTITTQDFNTSQKASFPHRCAKLLVHQGQILCYECLSDNRPNGHQDSAYQRNPATRGAVLCYSSQADGKQRIKFHADMTRLVRHPPLHGPGVKLLAAKANQFISLSWLNKLRTAMIPTFRNKFRNNPKQC